MLIETYLIDSSNSPVKADLYKNKDTYLVEYYISNVLKEQEFINKNTSIHFLESYIQNKLKRIVMLKE